MENEEFWSRLEFVVSGEMEGIPECRARGMWCDGLVPDSLRASPPSIVGRWWEGKTGKLWPFRLMLPEPVEAWADVPWDRLIPPCDTTRWLTVDFDDFRIEIDPALAVTEDARALCEECGSTYRAAASSDVLLCPECAHWRRGFPPCEHEMQDGRCAHCWWDGSTTDFV